MVDLQLDNIKTAAVIGHGPSGAESKRGREIDEHAVVGRMVNCAWQPPTDYGSRYSIGIYCPKQPKLCTPGKPLPDLYWVRYDPQADPGERCREEKRLRDRRVLCFDAYLYTIRCGLTPGAPHWSRGSALAAILLRFAPELRTLSLYFFDKMAKPEEPDHHPEALKRAHPLPARYITHAWLRERHALEILAAERGVTLQWI